MSTFTSRAVLFLACALSAHGGGTFDSARGIDNQERSSAQTGRLAIVRTARSAHGTAAKRSVACTGRRAVMRRVRVVRAAVAARSVVAAHAGHRAVAVTRFQRGLGRATVKSTAGSTTKLADGLLGGSDRAEAGNYSAVYTTHIRDLRGSEFIGEIGVGTKRLPKECNTVLSQVAASGRAARTNIAACRAREQQTLRVIFDTGSSNIWMASDLCRGICESEDRRRYNHTESSTYVPLAQPHYADVRFGTLALQGPQGIDNFHIGPFTLKSQSFHLIEKGSGYSFEELPLEGIVGLGFPSMAKHGEVPFFDNVIRQGLLEHNEFAFYVSNSEESRGGAIYWGGVDPDRFEGTIVMFPVTQPHYWALDLHEFRVGDESLSVDTGDLVRRPDTAPYHVQHSVLFEKASTYQDVRLATQMPKLIVDSGTTYVTAEPQLYREIAKRLPDGPCADTVKYPNLVFTLKDASGKLRDLDLPPEDYMASSDGGKTCQLSLIELAIPEAYGPGMVAGENFLQRYFTVFDRGSGAPEHACVGFARAKHDTKY